MEEGDEKSVDQFLDNLQEKLRLWRSELDSFTRTDETVIMDSLVLKFDELMGERYFVSNCCPPSLRHKLSDLVLQFNIGIELLLTEIIHARKRFICLDRMKTISVHQYHEQQRRFCEEEELCSICLDQICLEQLIGEKMKNRMAIKVTECGHKFHAVCLYKWLRSGFCCPICRFPI